ncbi:MAG: hypothetical protein KKF30_11115 [Proteobacteria bacterium]|nr:hypothetical protein [Pseudomonadota bacterium]MBU4469008.1 hypothetical protein [Pseudomonadota bacterium]
MTGMETKKTKLVVGKMRKIIIKCPVQLWRSFSGLFSDKAENAREEEKINEIVKKIIDHGLLMGERKYIPQGPVLYSKLPLKSNPQ